MQPHKMGDINPLDLLATAAASLQSANIPTKLSSVNSQTGQEVTGEIESESSDEAEGELATIEQDIKVNHSNSHNITKSNNNEPTTSIAPTACNGHMTNTKGASLLQNIANGKFQLIKTKGVASSAAKSSLTVRDATKLVLHDSQTGKNLTVLKINKQQMPDHSYAFVGRLSQANVPKVKVHKDNQDALCDNELVNQQDASAPVNVNHVKNKSHLSIKDNFAIGEISDETELNNIVAKSVGNLNTEKRVCDDTVLHPEKIMDSSGSMTDKNVVLRALLGGSSTKPYKVCLSRKTNVLSDPQECNQKLVCVPDDSIETESNTKPVQTCEINSVLEKDTCTQNNITDNVDTKSLKVLDTCSETDLKENKKMGKDVLISGSIDEKIDPLAKTVLVSDHAPVEHLESELNNSDTTGATVLPSITSTPTVTPLAVQVQSVQSGPKHNVKLLLSPISLTSLKQVEKSHKMTLHRDSIDSGIEKDIPSEALQTSDYETDHCWQHSSSDESCDANASSDSEMGSCIISPTLPSDTGSTSNIKQTEADAAIKIDVKQFKSLPTGLMSPPPAVQYVVKSVKGNHKTVIPIQKYQYIIEDDIPPTSKFHGPPTISVSKDSGKMITNKSCAKARQGLLLVSQPKATVSGEFHKPSVVSDANRGHLTMCTSSVIKPGQLPAGAQLLLAKPVPVVNTSNTLVHITPTSTVIPQGIIYKSVPKQGINTSGSTLLLPKIAPVSSSTSSTATLLGRNNHPARVKTPVKSLLNNSLNLENLEKNEVNVTELPIKPDEELVDVVGDQSTVHFNHNTDPDQDTSIEEDKCVTDTVAAPLHGTSFAPITNDLASCESSRSNTPVSNSAIERWTINSSITGRQTPSVQTTSLQNENSSPSEKINVKIASSKIVEVSTPEVDEENEIKSPVNTIGEYKSASIGTLGSISWTNLSNETDSDVDGTKEVLQKKPITCAALSEHLLGKLNSEKQSVSLPFVSSPSSSATTTPKVKRPYNRKKPKVLKVDVQTVGNDDSVNNLHPLIDHDYCAFTSFSAVVQSSIIATTELKFFKKNSRKKLAKTKDISSQSTDNPAAGLPEIESSEKVTVSEDDPKLNSFVDQTGKKLPKKYHLKRLKKLKEKTKLLKAKKKIFDPPPISSNKDKNFVKITGSFQDDFVYYAAKSYRKKPRKFNELAPEIAQSVAAPKLSAVGGLSVFDWYKDLSKADKSSKFGLLESGVPSGHAALHDTDVVDLVYEMEMESETNSNAGISDTGQLYPDKPEVSGESISFDSDHVHSVFNAIDGVLNNISSKSSGNPSVNDDSGIFSPGGTVVESEPTCIERPVANSGMPMNTLLSSYVEDPSETASNQLCDLDEINDSDLFSGDINNMTDLLGEVASSSSGTPLSNSVVDSTVTSYTSTSFGNMLEHGGKKEMLERIKSGLVSGAEIVENSSGPGDTYGEYSGFSFGKNSLDRSELFPDMSQPEPTVMNDVIVPELTIVSMYWNDLPGLVINGKQYVRLVDIHKQMLPAKDTGILKKRCQMLALEIESCTEMQRDFLIRYANAAKSKSCVIIPKMAAETLIGFYVEPRPKSGGKNASNEAVRLITPHELEREPSTPTQASTGGIQGLLQTECIENVAGSAKKKSSEKGKVGGKNRQVLGDVQKTVTTQENVVKRSERLRVRQRKISYAKLHEGGLDSSSEGEKSTSIREKRVDSHQSNLRSTKGQFKLRIAPKRYGRSSNNKPSKLMKLEHLKEQNIILEKEIAKLKRKARKRALNSRDRQRFMRLKDRITMLRRQVRQRQKEVKQVLVTPRKMIIKRKTKEVINLNTENVDIQVSCKKNRSSLSNKVNETHLKENDKNEPKIVLRIIHVDNVRRNVQRCRSQEGDLLLHLYKSKFANCVQCCACRYKYNIYKFMKHLHHGTDADDMYAVTLPQRLELAVVDPTVEQLSHWQKFLEIRNSFEKELTKPVISHKVAKEVPSVENSSSDIHSNEERKVEQCIAGQEAEIKKEECDPISHTTSAECSGDVKLQSKMVEKVDTLSSNHSECIEGNRGEQDKKMTESTSCEKPGNVCDSPVHVTLPVETTKAISTFEPKKKGHKEIVSVRMKSRTKSAMCEGTANNSQTRTSSSGMRHSSRVRKRKQYHPIESYVFNQGGLVGPTPSKISKGDSISNVVREYPSGISREF